MIFRNDPLGFIFIIAASLLALLLTGRAHAGSLTSEDQAQFSSPPSAPFVRQWLNTFLSPDSNVSSLL